MAVLVTPHDKEEEWDYFPYPPLPRGPRTYKIQYLCKGADEEDKLGKVYVEDYQSLNEMQTAAREFRLMGLDAFKYPQSDHHSPAFVCLRPGTSVPHPETRSWNEIKEYLNGVFDTTFSYY
jgi:hypothetical protein